MALTHDRGRTSLPYVCSSNVKLRKQDETELSKHIWNLKDASKTFNTKWKIIKKCKPYSNSSKKCNLCLSEKFTIICKKHLCSLNKRNELASPCPHRKQTYINEILYNCHLATYNI